MTPHPVCFATISEDFNSYMDLMHQAIPISPSFFIIVGALLLVSGAVFVWAAFFRKRRAPRYHYPRRDRAAGSPAEASPARWGLFTRKRRRHRRRSRPRNPTLAEAGGLPPVRSGPENPDPH